MELLTLHDILVAWQQDRIDYREGMRLAKIDTLDELYEAADLSGVEIRTQLHDFENRQAGVVADLIRGHSVAARSLQRYGRARILSTRTWLNSLERAHVIASADEIILQMKHAGRNLSIVEVDRSSSNGRKTAVPFG